MNLKRAIQATLQAGFVIFAWGAASHNLLPDPVTLITDTRSVDEFTAKTTPSNGAFLDPRGVMVIVGYLPDKSNRADNIGPQLAIEFATNVFQAFLLLVVLRRVKARSVVDFGKLSAILGVMAWVSIEVSYWNWYNFSVPLLVMGFLDSLVGFFLAGACIGWFIRKWGA